MFLGVLASALVVGAPAVSAAAQGSQAFQHGKTLFTSKCMVCHNKKPGNNAPFGPPNLYHVFGAKPPLLTEAQAYQIVTKGKGSMPAFGNAVSKTDLHDVIDYLRTTDRQKK